MTKPIPDKNLTHKIIGKCMEIHRTLGKGFLEIVYKDALEIELTSNKIQFQREVKYDVVYKGQILPHSFFADFVINDEIIVEIKSREQIDDATLSQTINYLKVSGNRIGLIVNFGKDSLEFKRVIY